MRFSVQIAIGFTRIVFLTKNYVFKIPRFHLIKVPLYIIEQYIAYGSYYEYNYRYKQWMNGLAAVNLGTGRMLTIGVISNLRETYRWFSDRNPKRVPVKFFIPGLLVVMPRGQQHPEDERPQRIVYDANFDRERISFENLDDRPANKVILDGQEKFCDYASIEDPVTAR